MRFRLWIYGFFLSLRIYRTGSAQFIALLWDASWCTWVTRILPVIKRLWLLRACCVCYNSKIRTWPDGVFASARVKIERAMKTVKAISFQKERERRKEKGEEHERQRDAVDIGRFPGSHPCFALWEASATRDMYTGWAATRKIARFRTNAHWIFLFYRRV